MWATTVPKTIEKKCKTTLPLEKYLAISRAEFVEQRRQVPELKKKAEELKQS